MASVTPELAGRLKTTLTPLGGERSGNADGSIPAWTGGITSPVPGYTVGDHHPDPYSDDKPIKVIDRDSLAKYQDVLPIGLQAILKGDPDYKVRVYSTRRSASAPQRIYDATFNNATSAKLVSHGNGVEGVSAGIPFPIPQSGLEVVWNHILRYRGENVVINADQYAIFPNGSKMAQRRTASMFFVYGRSTPVPSSIKNSVYLYKLNYTAPASLAGSALVVTDPIDQTIDRRKVWRYDPGSRRVTNLPNISYDAVQPDTNGLMLSDSVDVYNGAPDKYEWSLIEKREVIVPYNSYKVHQKGITVEELMHGHYLNSNLLRYELHRVWIVEGILRTGHRHVYGKRRFYVDEDSWQILFTDLYDRSGQNLIGFQEVHPINYYEVPLISSTLETTYNIKDQTVVIDGVDNNRKMYDFGASLSPQDFTAASLRRTGK